MKGNEREWGVMTEEEEEDRTETDERRKERQGHTKILDGPYIHRRVSGTPPSPLLMHMQLGGPWERLQRGKVTAGRSRVSCLPFQCSFRVQSRLCCSTLLPPSPFIHSFFSLLFSSPPHLVFLPACLLARANAHPQLTQTVIHRNLCSLPSLIPWSSQRVSHPSVASPLDPPIAPV